MAHRRAKKEAFELFEKGFYPPDISATLQVSLRSVQRWFSEFKGLDSANPVDKNVGQTGTILRKEQEDTRQNYPDQDWVEFASKLTREHFVAHENARQKIQELLDQHLSQPELNTRIIHVLSLALARHTEAERIALSLDYLDVNRAAARVEKEGLVVSFPEGYE